MKYLIPIEIPDEMGDKIKAFYVTISNGFEQRDIRVNADAIPMPCKVRTTKVWERNGDIIVTYEKTQWDLGWNACVEMIEGNYDGEEDLL